MTIKKFLITFLIFVGVLAAGVVLFLVGDHNEETDPSGSTRAPLSQGQANQ